MTQGSVNDATWQSCYCFIGTCYVRVAFVLVILRTRETACAFRKSKTKRYLEDILASIQAIPFMQICGGVGRTAQAKNQHSNGLLNHQIYP
ncbi:hypothetical protein POTOM_002557 [Populus tomentosa]|uniref:Uncharacterized protein n=1 Tax=Populus tomentosa TaxID=118781 RepID=A0A8X8DJX5_POPTO|nr:hypothetical protein POTOM_002557 [Populus tomentosa]